MKKTVAVTPLGNVIKVGEISERKNGVKQFKKVYLTLTKEETMDVVLEWINGHLDDNEEQKFTFKSLGLQFGISKKTIK